MKKILGSLLILASLIFSMSSCTKEEESAPEMISYGMVIGDYPDATILTDDGYILEPTAATMPTGLRDGMRVLLDYLVKYNYDNGNRGVEILDIRQLSLSDPIDLTNPQTPDTYGDVPIVNFQWGQSGRYLNIMVTYTYAAVDKHTFNLVLKGYDAGTNTLNYEFRHTSTDNSDSYTGNELISFDLGDILPVGKTSVNFKIRVKGSGDTYTYISSVYPFVAEE
jgi:hypothetical protein